MSFAWDQKTPPATYLVDLASGKTTQIFTETRIQPDDFEWTLDSSGFYVNFVFEGEPASISHLRHRFGAVEDIFRVVFTLAPAPKPEAK